MGIDPDMRNTIWPNGSIAHLLCHAWPAVGVGSCIDPTLDSLCNKSAIGASANLDTEGRRMTIECEPFLVSIQHNFDWTSRFTRKASWRSSATPACWSRHAPKRNTSPEGAGH